MRNMVVLIDANVIIDYIASREPFYREAYKIMDMCYRKKVKGYIAFHSVSIIWYTLRKFIPDNIERRGWLRKILKKDFKESTVTAVTPIEFLDSF